MDTINREDGIPYDPLFPGPPTLTECMLDFGHIQRGNKKTLQQIIANTTAQPMIWLGHTGEAKWITLEPDHGILQPGERQSIRVTADTRVLAIGEYCVTLTFSSEGDEMSMSKDTISKVKVEEASMPQEQSSAPLLLQAGLHLGWLTPQSTSTMGLVINNPDTRPINWGIQIGNDASGMGKRVHFDYLDQPASHWEDFPIEQQQGSILLSPVEKGSLGPGESVTVYVTANANPAQLQSDYSYTTNLTLTSKIAGAANAPSTSVQVPVTFYVSTHPYDDGGPKIPTGLPPFPNTSFTIPTGQEQGQTTLSFTNSEYNTVYWTLKPDSTIGWLNVSPSSGTLNPREQTSVALIATRANLQPGVHTTGLYLKLSYKASMVPVNAIAQPIPVTVMVE